MPPNAGLLGAAVLALTVVVLSTATDGAEPSAQPLPKVRISADGRTFQTEDGKPFVPMGINYYRPGTGWAPQLWKKFDAEATRRDFARMKELGVNCVRVFLTYGSFFMEPDALRPEGLARFDELLAIAEQAGIYVHPTGPDHWEGTPPWAATDRFADERVLTALENFWKLFAQRYRGRNVIFAYDLLNEPEVRWDTPAMRSKWNRWLESRYGSALKVAEAWQVKPESIHLGEQLPSAPKDALGNKELLDYQHFREEIADEWTRRQAAAIKAADDRALVTVGMIQWSVPAMLPGVQNYAAFRPQRQARLLDFLEIHFYPLVNGFYDYTRPEDEDRNLAYLESVVREVAAAGKPVVLAEFGWYGGGKMTIDGGAHPAATEEQQARWCRRAVETTKGLATGWLNWGFYDHPEARDTSQLSGLLTVDGRPKVWAKDFQDLAQGLRGKLVPPAKLGPRPTLDWDRCITSLQAGQDFREKYYKAWTGPVGQVDDIIFCTRSRYDDPHWYANIGYYCDDEKRKAYPGNGRPDDGKLYKLNLRTGEAAVLLDAKGGSVRDPQVHYDGRKILFSCRKAGSEFFHLYEIHVDGSGLRQLTSGEFDDYEPTYLPDGGIAFVSTRCQRWVNCWMTQVGVIYRCDANGRNIRLISPNTEHDNTPWVMPDGRILYTRWEYVDRSQVEFHHLWTMNPDGTGQAVYFGNMHPLIVMIDAKPIPGTQKVVASFSPGHGVNEHAGIATVISAQKGPDDLATPKPIHKGALTEDPYPVSEHSFLVARGKQIVWLDGSGREQVIYTYPGEGGVHEPRPIVPRPREPIISPHSKPSQPAGHMILADVYRGRNLSGIAPGEIKKLLVLESLPKQVNFSGGPDLVSWLGTFTLERVLGTVPVEEDGSAYFEVPADRQVFFVALDEHDLSVKRMQSWCGVMPGETISCVGCHERRVETPRNPGHGTLMALRRPPSKIEPFTELPDVLDFTRDIQPILDRHCVKCHDYAKPEGKVILSGDLGPQWSHAYFSLLAHRQVADGRNGLGNQPPRTLGSSASVLLKKVDGSHYDVRVSPPEWRTLWLWLESGAPYAGTYAALRNERQQQAAVAATAAVFGQERATLRRRCGSCHEETPDAESGAKPLPLTQDWGRKNQRLAGRPTAIYERIVVENDPIARFSPNILLNFSRPELSPLLLGPLTTAAGGYGSCGAVFGDKSDPDYRRLLAAIQKGKSLLDAEPRFGTPGFRPNRQYVREMKRYRILPASFDPAKDPIDVFRSDQDYWRSFWYQPLHRGAVVTAPAEK